MSIKRHLYATILKLKSQPRKFLSIKRRIYFLKPSAAERARCRRRRRARRGHKRVSTSRKSPKGEA